jgi:hypothetical protein
MFTESDLGRGECAWRKLPAKTGGRSAMIVFELICDEEHRFEGWFASAEEYERQEAASLLSCPVCASPGVRKLPSARIRKPGARAPGAPPQPKPPSVQPSAGAKEVTLASFVEHILANTEDVGRRFPEEARKIHYEETARRAIRGIATQDETRELVDEGIPVVPLPMPPRGDLH